MAGVTIHSRAPADDPALARLRGDWTTDRNNPRLLTFHASLGAAAQDDKAFFRLSDDALAALADAPEI